MEKIGLHVFLNEARLFFLKPNSVLSFLLSLNRPSSFVIIYMIL